MESLIESSRHAVEDLCREFGVRRLLLFGSALSGGFDERRSDVDFLVDFEASVPSHFEAYFGLKEGLEQLLGRPVDLVESAAVQNPFFAAAVERESRELYAA